LILKNLVWQERGGMGQNLEGEIKNVGDIAGNLMELGFQVRWNEEYRC
jgi:hypothetical protein